MTKTTIHKIITYNLAAFWFVMGFYCKVLGLVPRHEQIVGRILGPEHAGVLTILIGASEMMMAFWILSNRKTRLNATVQMLTVGIMNLIEIAIVPDLLYWGKFNIIFALLFIAVIYYNEFHLKRTIQSES